MKGAGNKARIDHWRSGRDSVDWCAFLRIHGHWCVTGIRQCRTVTHADTAIVLKSSWNPGILSRFSGETNPDRCERPGSGRRLQWRVPSIGHTSARLATWIKGGLSSGGDHSLILAAVRDSSFRRIRATTCSGRLLSMHSRTRITDHPAARSWRDTRLSRCMFV